MPAAEVRPERVRHPDFGVRNLPEQEIADAHFAARADQEIGIGLAGGVEKLAELALVEICRRDAGRHRAACRIDDLGAAAVVEGDVEEHARVLRRTFDGHRELGLHVGRELVRPPDHLKANVVPQQRRQLEAQIALQQQHQRVDLGARALPVLHRKRVEGQDVDAEPRRRFDDVAHRVDAGAVAFDARQMTLRGPPAVAVHDDGNVGGELLEIDLSRQVFVRRSRRNPGQELL